MLPCVRFAPDALLPMDSKRCPFALCMSTALGGKFVCRAPALALALEIAVEGRVLVRQPTRAPRCAPSGTAVSALAGGIRQRKPRLRRASFSQVLAQRRRLLVLLA